MQATTLRPGMLVSLNTRLVGGVQYARADIEAEHLTEDGKRTAKWETRKTVLNPEEHERATQARSKARAAVTSVCSYSSFGLLCPVNREQELTDAIAEARRIAYEHNTDSKTCKLDVYVLVGRIAQDDVEAARAIRAEIRALVDDMTAGIKAADPERIRDAASKARQLGQMLSTEAAAKVSDAVAEARKAARAIVKRVAGSADTAAAVIAEVGTVKLNAARFAFLDLDEGEGTAPPPIASAIDISSLGMLGDNGRTDTDGSNVPMQASPMLELF